MRDYIKGLTKGFSIYFVSSALNKSIPFLLLPVLTRYLQPAEYGVFALFQVFVSFAVPLVGMNMQNNITRNYFNKNKKYVAEILSNIVVILLFNATVILLIISIFILLFDNNLGVPDRWLYAILIISVMNCINQYNLTILRNQKKPIAYGVYDISNTIINFSITLVLVVTLGYGWEGPAAGILISSIIIGLASIIRIYKNDFIKYNITNIHIREILKISLPFIPHALGLIIITKSDRLFIDNMVGKEAVGIYAVGYQIGMIVLLFTNAFNKSWSPWLYEQLADIAKKKTIIIKLTYLSYLSILLLAIIITATSYLLLDLFIGSDYYGAKDYVLWISLAYAFNGMYMLVFPYLVHVGKTKFFGVSTSIAAIFNLVGNYILISINGPIGAAQSTLIAYFISFISVWWYSNKVYPMPWRYWK